MPKKRAPSRIGSPVLRPGLPPGLASVQGCLDLTGNPENNLVAAANGHAPDFSRAAETGICNSANLPATTIQQGLYDRRDPRDVNQFGARFGANVGGVGFTLAYMYRRHLGADIPGATLLKSPFGRLSENAVSKFGYVAVAPHQTTDPILRKTTFVDGYLRVPVQVYYPYVPVAGLSGNYFERSRRRSRTACRSASPTSPAAIWLRERTFSSGRSASRGRHGFHGSTAARHGCSSAR